MKGVWITHITRSHLLAAGLPPAALVDERVYADTPASATIRPECFAEAIAACDRAIPEAAGPGAAAGLTYTKRKLRELSS